MSNDYLKSKKFFTKKDILLIALAAAFALVSSITSYSLFFQRSLEDKAEKVNKIFYFETPDEITFTLKGDEQDLHQIRVGISIRLKNQAIEKLLTERKDELNDELVRFFHSQNFNALKTRNGRKHLREEVFRVIQTMLSPVAGDDAVTAVYFSTFVME